MTTFNDVRLVAVAMPGVEEGSSYGTPALKVKKKLLVRLREEGDVIVLKMPFDLRTELMDAEPGTYFITDHYAGHEWVLVHLARLSREALPDLLNIAYRAATGRRKPNLLS